MQHPTGLLLPAFTLLIACFASGCGVPKEQHSSQSAASSSAPNTTVQACPGSEIPVTPLRRLTRFEYQNSVRDLLGVDTSAVQQIPADESDGFDNNSAIQVAPEFLVEKYVQVSEALAAQAVQNVTGLTGCNAAVTGEQTCASRFAQSFGRRAFRRPLTSADESLFMAAYETGRVGGSHAEGIELMIRMALQSPNFLYRLELGSSASGSGSRIPLTPYEIATRLAYFLWGTGPDDALLDAAASGNLSSKAQVAAKAREMLASPKAQDSLINFLNQWSGLRKLAIVSKNTDLFPKYSEAVRAAMERELPAFVADMWANQQVSLNTLFTSNKAFVSGPLASIYGVNAPADSQTTARAVTLPASHERAGLLTQAGFLAVQAHPDQTSAVLRGKFVRTKLLCEPPPPPPDDVNISIPEITSGSTARERASIHLSAGGSCAGCHQLMDPIGLAFENFDAIGQHRLYEQGVTIDVSGEVMFTSDEALKGAFHGVRELAIKLAQSEKVEHCVATQMFRFAAGRYESDQDTCSLSGVQDVFSSSDGNLMELMVAMTQADAFLYRSAGVPQ